MTPSQNDQAVANNSGSTAEIKVPDEAVLVESARDEMNHACEILDLVGAESGKTAVAKVAERLCRELRTEFTHWELAQRSGMDTKRPRGRFIDVGFQASAFLNWQGKQAESLAGESEASEAYGHFCDGAGSRLGFAICELMDRLEGKAVVS